MDVTYIGGPTALLTFAGVRFLTDPTFDPPGDDYRTGPVTLHKTAAPALTPDAAAFDYVLLSHDHHFDNLDRAGRAALTRAAVVVTTVAAADRLGGNARGLNPWQTLDLPAANGKTLRITATPARHGPADGDRGPVAGFVLHLTSAPDRAVYFSGDTVWYEGVEEIARRLPVRAAVLNLGAARVPEVGPQHLTMTAAEAVQAARAFPDAAIVPLHFEGWQHFSEGRDVIAREFAAAGLEHRLHWPDPGRPIRIDLDGDGDVA
jgi:L-ascorbate metabolism protein UlaG (beta-lactamase superfamily)